MKSMGKYRYNAKSKFASRLKSSNFRLVSCECESFNCSVKVGQVDEVLKYFNGKKNGFFVEAGAFDGEFFSNTLLLEVITYINIS